MSYPGAAAVKVLSNRTVEVRVVRNAKSIYARAGIADIAQGATEVVVTFTTPLPSTDYVLGALTLVNTADNKNLAPFMTVRGISALSQVGFTVQLSAPTLTGNYKLHWSIAEEYNP